ncbi:unnamed protein product [Phyllotreta striolata]|uniref:Tyrosine-protein kinase catalytic domain-containing protein n=1 Tax=Phyllotreta striolata TaxID=444603 RepID=A0A9N9TYB5_PHYSR|nr:unnamed protein product [Phyllotreta striolata]
MKVLLAVFLHVQVALCVYFSMTDVKLTVPRAIKKYMLHPYDRPIINLTAINRENQPSNLKYSLNGTGEYLQVNSNTGGVFLTPKFLSQIEKIGTIVLSAHVQETGDPAGDGAVIRVTTSPAEGLDCGELVEDVCFWTEARYVVKRRDVATPVGALSSPRLLDVCPYRVSYTVKTGSSVEVFPPSGARSFWAVGASLKMKKSSESEAVGEVFCNVEAANGEQGKSRRVGRTIKILVMDEDGHLPVPQFSEITIEMQQRRFKKGERIHHPHLIFTDDDSAKANHYKATVDDGNDRSFLKPICSEREFSRNNKTQTAIHCKLEFKQDMVFNSTAYSFVLSLNDTTFKGDAPSTVDLPIHLVFKDKAESLMMLKLYPSTPKIFRTAAPLARVAQPNSRGKNYRNFKLLETSKFKGIFRITDTQGIIFVHDNLKLKNITTQFLGLTISWLRDNKEEFDEIQVRIVKEPNETCSSAKRFADWAVCSEFETIDECLGRDSCGIGTGGSASVESRRGPERCMWRGDAITSNSTHLYSTCTPDVNTCPDGECDSLESLSFTLCPQDCTESVSWPLKLARGGKGVDEASGTVICSSLGCTRINSRRSQIKKRKDDKAKQHHDRLLHTLSKAVNESFVQKENITMGALVKTHCDFLCVIGIGSASLFIISTIVFVTVYWSLRKSKKSARSNPEKSNQELTAPLSLPSNRNNFGDSLSFNFQLNDTTFINNFVKKHTPDPKWEFPRSQLVIEQTLGEGEFGKVLRAKAHNVAGKPGLTTVAVKTLKDDARESELNDLLSEYQLLKEVSHPNVIRLLGVCTSPGGPVYVIIEYAELGSLRNYLRRTRKLQTHILTKEELVCHYDEPKVSDVTPKDLLSFAWQICNGMHYLSDMKLVHRDLAARNVLLSSDKVCKVSDFGLTRDVYEDNAYLKRSKGRVPVKWMAPESLSDHIYTTKSDVWSFGILIWELVTLGATPYPGIAVQNLFHLLRQGYRMERPDNCSPDLYKIMRNCWDIDPEQRPTFLELSMRFAKLLEDKMEYINLSSNAIYNKGYFASPFNEEDEIDEGEITPESSETSPLNYLSRTTSYEKCDAREREINEEMEKIAENSQAYETPVKIPRIMKTPSNENPQEYTDMGGK